MNLKLLSLLCAAFLATSCASLKVQDEDLNAWKNQDVLKVETHPFFSPLSLDKRTLDNGQVLLNFKEKKRYKQREDCVSVGMSRYSGAWGSGFGTRHCGPKTVEVKNCVHQFLVENGTVLSYNVLGEDCYTTCKNRPDTSLCKD